jgi:hypothetical protein
LVPREREREKAGENEGEGEPARGRRRPAPEGRETADGGDPPVELAGDEARV